MQFWPLPTAEMVARPMAPLPSPAKVVSNVSVKLYPDAVHVQLESRAVQPSWDMESQVMGVVWLIVPSEPMLTTTEGMGPQLPDSSVNDSMYVAPLVAHGFAWELLGGELDPQPSRASAAAAQTCAPKILLAVQNRENDATLDLSRPITTSHERRARRRVS